MNILGYKIQGPSIKKASKLPFTGDDHQLRHYENQSATIFDEIFDKSFGAFADTKHYVELASQTEFIDTILLYLSQWFTMGNLIEEDANGNPIEDGPLLNLLNNPNPDQGLEEFMTEWLYYILAAGTNYVLPDNVSIGFEGDPEGAILRNLNFDNVVEPNRVKSIFDLDRDFEFRYREYLQGVYQDTTLSFSEVIPFYDSLNGIDSKHYKGKSRLESIKDEIKNIRLAVKAKQNQIDISGIALVTPETEKADGTMSEGLDGTMAGSSQTHKQHIEHKFKASGLTKGRSIIVASRQLKVMNLSEPLSKLDFDKLKIEDLRAVKRKFGIPEELLPLTNEGSKYENQDKATLNLLQTMIEPFSKMLSSGINNRFNTGTSIKWDYRHLPAYSVVTQQKTASQQQMVDMVSVMIDKGLATVEQGKFILNQHGFDL